jgi:deazaflavin-dependent oxidoreductase (nitroreductase family)
VILPRWLLRTGWALHRGIHAASGGRLGTLRPNARGLGTLFLETTGRRSGAHRRTGLYYIEDGPNLVIVASNAGADRDPAWWLNLQAHPEATVEVGGTRRAVRARNATPDEEERLWPRLVRGFRDYATYRRTTTRPIPIVILEPAT